MAFVNAEFQILRNTLQRKREIQPKNSNRKYRIPNIVKYLAAKTGNPTEKWLSDRDYLIATGRDLIATGRNLIATISFRSSSNR